MRASEARRGAAALLDALLEERLHRSDSPDGIDERPAIGAAALLPVPRTAISLPAGAPAPTGADPGRTAVAEPAGSTAR